MPFTPPVCDSHSCLCANICRNCQKVVYYETKFLTGSLYSVLHRRGSHTSGRSHGISLSVSNPHSFLYVCDSGICGSSVAVIRCSNPPCPHFSSSGKEIPALRLHLFPSARKHCLSHSDENWSDYRRSGHQLYLSLRTIVTAGLVAQIILLIQKTSSPVGEEVFTIRNCICAETSRHDQTRFC